jgi:hypothetical protein
MKHERNAPASGADRQTRRDFLTYAGRIGLAGALAALGIALFRGRGAGAVSRATGAPNRTPGEPGAGPAVFACTGNDYCRACARVSDCGLPQALSYRRKFGG